MTVHIPVLVEEVLSYLTVSPGSTVVDGTLGGGGHTGKILDLLGPEGQVIAFDRDPLAVEETKQRLNSDRLTLIQANYADIPEHLEALGIQAIDGLLLDLGLSSDQLAARDRGFSYQDEGTLDLRFNPMAGEPAFRIVNRLSEKHLADLIYEFGEERFSRRIARKIVKIRRETPIQSAVQLAALVRSCVPRSKNHSIDPATRTFQALRIAVNEELKWLKVASERLPSLLAPGGRIAIISFHSLEDRIVKHAFQKDDRLEMITKKPIQASKDELARNPRSRSAKLRVAEKKR
ncbi:MAG: 16S rRNA (cytosine(1402)-N(4))-methyltransferase RsmH [Planctomycetota bacterium]